MASHRPGWRRMATKTHGTFETIPTLRVPGRDMSGSASSRKTAPKKQPLYADPTLFPGRRLDRRQQSSYSGLSGHSGLSGIDQLTLPGSGRFRTTSSTTGSTKHSSLPSAGLSRTHFLADSSDPWGTSRQLPLAREDSPLTMLRRQAVAARDEQKSLSGSVPVALSANPAVPLASDSRWRPADLSIRRPATREELLESPDSLESHESELQAAQEQLRLQQLRLRDHQQRQLRQQEQTNRGRYTPPPLKLDVTPPSQQTRAGVRHLNPHRKPSRTPVVSPTAGHPQLDKILWALVPDEFANISESGVSGVQPSCHGASTGETGQFVTVTDFDSQSGEGHQRVPNTPRRPRLTEQLLSGHEMSSAYSRDDRIVQWLAECDQETTSHSLPTHLPDISYTFKYLKSAT